MQATIELKRAFLLALQFRQACQNHLLSNPSIDGEIHATLNEGDSVEAFEVSEYLDGIVDNNSEEFYQAAIQHVNLTAEFAFRVLDHDTLVTFIEQDNVDSSSIKVFEENKADRLASICKHKLFFGQP